MTGRNTITMTQRTPTTTRRMTCLSKAASGLGCLTMFGLASTASATATGFSFETSLVDQSGWSSTDPRTLVSVKVYIDFDDELDRLVIVNGKPGFNLALSTDDAAGFFHSANASSDTSDSRTSAAIAVFPSAEADSYVSIGLLNNDSGTDAVITTGMDWATFNGGGPLQVLDTDQGGGWLVTPDDDQGDATDGHVFIGQFTVASGSAISGTLNYMYIDNATETNIEVDGATISAFANPVSTGGKSDFNGDGQDDVLWQCDDAASAYDTSVLAWLNWDGTDGGYDSDVLWNSDALGVDIPASWEIQGSGDLDGDGDADILWRGSAGETLVWSLDGEVGDYDSTVMYAAGISGWEVRAIGDFNDDGQDDVLWQCTDAGSDYYTSVLAWINWDGTDEGYTSCGRCGTPMPWAWTFPPLGRFRAPVTLTAMAATASCGVVLRARRWSGRSMMKRAITRRPSCTQLAFRAGKYGRSVTSTAMVRTTCSGNAPMRAATTTRRSLHGSTGTALMEAMRPWCCGTPMPWAWTFPPLGRFRAPVTLTAMAATASCGVVLRGSRWSGRSMMKRAITRRPSCTQLAF